jgi:hypothetical protein
LEKEMAQFYAEVTGRGQGTATKVGDKATGIGAHVRGWNVGAYVNIQHENGKDVVRVYRTTGSSGNSSRELVATFSDE